MTPARASSLASSCERYMRPGQTLAAGSLGVKGSQVQVLSARPVVTRASALVTLVFAPLRPSGEAIRGAFEVARTPSEQAFHRPCRGVDGRHDRVPVDLTGHPRIVPEGVRHQ